MTGIFAHSVPGQPSAQWEPLADHLARVGDTAARLAGVFGWGELARLAGTLHDVGKASEAFQAYLHGRAPSCDHSTAGARVAAADYPHPVGRILATLVAGHHAGLDDGDGIDRRLDPRQTEIPTFDGWQSHAAALPPMARLAPTRRFARSGLQGFTDAFLIRMLFSCLVDADCLETERFYAGARPVPRGGHPGIATLQARLRAHMDAVSAAAPPSRVNAVRAEVLASVRERAALDPGLFTLTVPTGGGKTLASLTFALYHAARHGLRRVVHVAPFTAIIEQTAAVFRTALGEESGILEHHATFDWQAAAARSRDDGTRDDGTGLDPVSRLRRAAENWDAPVVVTTAVQLFESLFANRTARCRKLHNLAASVIVLDEAQAMPLPLLRPCLTAIEELTRNYGASVVLCTATQPALRRVDGFADGLPVDDARELAPDPPRLARTLRRVAVERIPGPTTDETVARRFAETSRMLTRLRRVQEDGPAVPGRVQSRLKRLDVLDGGEVDARVLAVVAAAPIVRMHHLRRSTAGLVSGRIDAGREHRDAARHRGPDRHGRRCGGLRSGHAQRQVRARDCTPHWVVARAPLPGAFLLLLLPLNAWVAYQERGALDWYSTGAAPRPQSDRRLGRIFRERAGPALVHSRLRDCFWRPLHDAGDFRSAGSFERNLGHLRCSKLRAIQTTNTRTPF